MVPFFSRASLKISLDNVKWHYFYYSLLLLFLLFSPLPLKLLEREMVISSSTILLHVLFLYQAFFSVAFIPYSNSCRQKSVHQTALAKVSIPSSTNDRNKQAIDSIKAAISSPRDPSFRLIETEFPALQALNKLGDGSLKSGIQSIKIICMSAMLNLL